VESGGEGRKWRIWVYNLKSGEFGWQKFSKNPRRVESIQNYVTVPIR
jgi:hypothetical protein